MRLGQGARLLEVWGAVMDAIYLLMVLACGVLSGAVLWRSDAMDCKAARKSKDALRRYRWAVDELDRWCGHESPHARLIAAHIRACGEGEAKNAGTPCGDEVCDIQGTRQQLRKIDAAKADELREVREELAGLKGLMEDAEWLKAELACRPPSITQHAA